ncbi:hypothetical protein H4R21_005362 [Coemansia helicoidea]|uniref:Uncharacterized protein n=1 Tax=Coemansia helicoidea TaxID=1286919 RepID=A0ACC1KTR0_9FUNG|nr:hypothetical protein H4R21_005362 [Coemansia helicoidea]
MDAISGKSDRSDKVMPRPRSGALRLSTGTVQCAYLDLKREALSELFDHCMTPLVSPRTPGSEQSGWPQRARPLSAAPALDIDISHDVLAPPPVSAPGLLSPEMPADQGEPAPCTVCTLDSSYFTLVGCDGDTDCDGSGDVSGDADHSHPQARSTFADLRRKLYGGAMHAVAAADSA